MIVIPESIVDHGYVNVTSFILKSITSLDRGMEVWFESRDERNKGFLIQMENVVASKSTIDTSSLFWIRVDGEDTSFAFDISIRLKDERMKKFHVLYFFKDEDHSVFVFRCLAEKISIVSYDNS